MNPDVYPSGINVPKHFTIICYGKLGYSFKQKNYKNKIYHLLNTFFNFHEFFKLFKDRYTLYRKMTQDLQKEYVKNQRNKGLKLTSIKEK